jgi:hypothetical protein
VVRDGIVGRLRSVGADDADVRLLLGRTVASVVFDLLYLLDEPSGTVWGTEPFHDVQERDSRWRLMEISPDGALTGRDVGGLHESLFEISPPRGDGNRWV